MPSDSEIGRRVLELFRDGSPLGSGSIARLYREVHGLNPDAELDFIAVELWAGRESAIPSPLPLSQPASAMPNKSWRAD